MFACKRFRKSNAFLALLPAFLIIPVFGCSNSPKEESFSDDSADSIECAELLVILDREETNSNQNAQLIDSRKEGTVKGNDKKIDWQKDEYILVHSGEAGPVDVDAVLSALETEQNYRCIKSADPSVITLQSNGSWYAAAPGRTKLTPLDLDEIRIADGVIMPSEENGLYPTPSESGRFIVLDSDPDTMFEIIHSDGSHEYTIDRSKAEKRKEEGCQVNAAFSLPSQRGNPVGCYKEKGKEGLFWVDQRSELYQSFEQQKLFQEDGRLEFVEQWNSAASSEPPIYCYRSDTGTDVILKAADSLMSSAKTPADPVLGYLQGLAQWNIPESEDGYHLEGVIGYCLYQNNEWLEFAGSVE